MKNPLLTAALAVLIISSSLGTNSAVAGFSISNLVRQAEVIKVNAVTSATSAAVKVSTTIKGFAANDPYFVKTMEVPKANVMANLRASSNGGMSGLVKRNAWYAAWFATMAAAGWAIDELHNQVVSKPKDFAVGVYYYLGSYGEFKNWASSTPAEACKGYFAGNTTWAFDSVKTPFTGAYGVCVAKLVSNPNSKSDMIRIYQTSCASNPSSVLPSCNNIIPTEPVPDDAIYDSLVSKMLEDPKAASQAFMVPDTYPYPYPNIFPAQVPYIPGVSEADQEALDLYYRGLLQSTNPNAPYYVSPERYQQIASLASQLQQGQSPDSEASAMNDQLKKPLTQKELEESLKKEREQQDKATKDALGNQPALDKLIDPFNNFSEGVKNTPNEVINELPSNNFSFSGAGKCYTFDKTYTIMGASWTLSTRQFCDAYYYPYFLPIMTWFFYIATGLYIWFSLRDAYARRF